MTCDLILAMRRCRRPIVAALNGTVAGAGAVIAAACDIRIAAETAKSPFCSPAALELSGADMGAAWLLPRLIGFGRAAELLLTGEFIDAKRAQRSGCNRVVPVERVLAEATRWPGSSPRGPPRRSG